MKRVYKTKKSREQLESDILGHMREIRDNLDPKILKELEIFLNDYDFPSKTEEGSQDSIPVDMDKSRETIELFLKLKEQSKEKPLH